MRLGITGHQERDGIDWNWVRSEIDQIVTSVDEPLVGYSSLAAGSDQVFAGCLLDHGAQVRAVIPLVGYERFFKPAALANYQKILRHAERIDLVSSEDPEECFMAAGIYVATHSDLMIAVWDEENAKGRGGTADIVRYCKDQDIPVIVLNPILRTVSPEPIVAAGRG
ncbi:MULTISPECIES: hypothetical protein [unclassified Ensifer]|uniref:hypothetical protein n=1 Tax=unclassified Ensifer TaxID=2633371 RepID=UPI00070CA912|nr:MULTISPECIES: hypothetical protein [unclassified Ensifer]KQW47215.1 hypothetical protein ASD02_34490 [Ensifer sp. Root1252]KRC68767.1 hypothetical protein ASE32_35320 [Ensifer sp. Root231]KRC93933.1 hypothetical protein ASE47_34985 [Ensifer sp. Root258]